VKLLVSLATHYVQLPDGSVYTDGPHRYKFWRRYLEVFDEVVILARCRPVEAVEPKWVRADGDGVRLLAFPDHAGPWEFFKVRGQLRRVAREGLAQAGACLLRTGGDPLNQVTACEALQSGHPYGVEVVADPWDSLSPGAYRSWVRPLARRACARNLRFQCSHAAAATYVTREALQRRYPPSPRAYSTYYSDVDMPPELIVPQPRRFEQPGSRIVFLGELQQLYKAPDVLVRAVGLCARNGVDVRVRFLGGGQQIPFLQGIAREVGAADRVEFLGQVAERETVIRELDEADLFVLPSRQEGLPRAMVEAMGRALPCVASTRGGMPELLPAEDLVPPDDTEALAAKLTEVLTDPQRLSRMSARNLERTDEYRADLLAARRLDFYQRLRTLSGGQAGV